MSLICFLVAVATIGLASVAVADEPAKLVEALGSRSFREREQAQNQLEALGELALPAIERGLATSADPEVQMRCESLIVRVRRNILLKQLGEFVRNGIQPGEKAFAGWEMYQKVAGNNEKSRQAFAEIYKDDSEFAKLTETNPKKAAQTFDNQCNELNMAVDRLEELKQNIAILTPQAVQLLRRSLLLNRSLSQTRKLVVDIGKNSQFADELRPIIAKATVNVVTEILVAGKTNNRDYLFIKEINELVPGLVRKDVQDQVRPVFQKAVEKLVNSPKAIDTSSFIQLLNIGKEMKLEEVVPLALKVAVAKTGWGLKAKKIAVTLVGKYGTINDIKILSTLLEDQTPIAKFGETIIDGLGFSSELRDEVLAALIQLSGSNLAEYGFTQPGQPNPEYQDRSFLGWGFFGNSQEEIDTVRQKALNKWKARQPM